MSTQIVMERLFDPVLAQITVPDTFPSNLATSIDELPDKATLVLGT